MSAGPTPRVLVAPDKFRGSLTAPEAATAVARGVVSAFPGAEVVLRPVADGGEGTVDAFVDAGWRPVSVRVAGPTDEAVEARYAVLGDRAVVELAECCGMQRLPGGVTAPRTATSRGAGEAMAAALRAGAREIVLGVGGSASTDGGVGLLAALGMVLRDAAGDALPPVPASLHLATSLDVSSLLEPLHDARILVATDVTNPLTGPDGAATVFGPQKGATPADVAWLAAGLERWQELLGAPVREVAGAGAAGGVPAGLLGALHGVAGVLVVSGADTVVELVGLAPALVGCDLAITGEGSFDRQSLAGKGPTAVARAAVAAGVPVAVVAGRLDVAPAELQRAGVRVARSLVELAREGEDPMRHAAAIAERAGTEVARAVLG